VAVFGIANPTDGDPRGGTLADLMPTAHRRIQVTEDPELTSALRAAAPLLPSGLSRAGLVRELTLVGARALVERETDGGDRATLLNRLADRFRDSETSAMDWEALRDGKPNAWPIA
jgi:hypothetical protein